MRTATRSRSTTSPSTSKALALVLKQEHERHAARLADIRRISTKLPVLDELMAALAAQKVHVALEELRPYRRVLDLPETVTLRTGLFGDGHDATVAATLLRLGFKVVWTKQGAALGRFQCEAIFKRGHAHVHAYVPAEWLAEACEQGLVTAATEGHHPANDVGRPLAAAAATAEAGA
ncbi:hypothetical protein [Pseudacidovorax intermedius]|uniref:Uncharacterized protein n=1 Tax=Pseudacidovorax intermedius TaxID=433924 RepID=A0A147H9C7_9BURK|nr:hypothetical protein [Pseudacidovorax intermedius]KTT26532.1 hypothetical protein NS331_03690 [Pseudacidovorax intermedius]